MDPRSLREDQRWSWLPSHALLVVPLALIVIVTIVDVLAPAEVHLGPFLVAAPAIAASFAGPRITAFVGAVAVLAQAVVAIARTTLIDLNHLFQITALILISAIVTFFSYLRERHEKELMQLRTVAEATQAVVLRPLPQQVGPLRIASVYLAAEAEAQIGGDLYAAVRTDRGTRFIIGDVRGKGLPAIGDAALLLGAFRAAAHRQADLPLLVAYLEGTVTSELDDPTAGVAEQEGVGEAFTTAAVLDVPDAEPLLHLINCGHPPPLLLHEGEVVPLEAGSPALPLGLAAFGEPSYAADTFGFTAGDTLVLYTDGVVEARDEHGEFYPLAERAATWRGEDPQTFLRHLCADLIDHAGGFLGDDAAVVVIQRLAAPTAAT
ncbi:PP2C family protein-serine/threonine phosphatase, partial [Streptomyces sp. NPDC054841]